nr:carbohydrate sulfotransferase 10-like isoform X1 [Cherax quadricarinatus]
MLSKQYKFLQALIALTVILCVYLNDNEGLTEYKMKVQTKLKSLWQYNQSSQSNITRVFLLSRNVEETETIDTSVHLIHAVTYSYTTTHNSSSATPVLLSSPAVRVHKPVIHKRLDKIVFPSISNCTEKNVRKNRIHRTKNKYPCKKWIEASPGDPYWPVVLSPTYGRSLQDLAHHQHPQSEQFINEQLVVQKQRTTLLAETCLKHPEVSIRQYMNLVWDTARVPPLIYCPIYKVASTTWMVYFLRLRHINDRVPELEQYDEQTQEQLKYMPRYGGGHQRVFKEYKQPKTSEEKNYVFKKALRFIVVRHPFTRILSVYRGKIERKEPRPFAPYFKHLQRAIIKRYRPPDTHLTSPTPTFSEFVDYVIDSTKNFKTAADWEKNVVCWTPYWVQCGVCASDYQVIIKLETMTTDEEFLAQIANLKEIQNLHEWRNLRNSPATSTATQSRYFKSLTKRQILLLFQRYQLDFELFGYSADEYLNFSEQD